MASEKSTLSVPTIEFLQEVNKAYRLECDENNLKEHQKLFQESIDAFNFVEDFELPKYVTKHSVDRRYTSVNKEDNEYNAWYVKCNMQAEGQNKGKLADKKIAIKDNVEIAGLPMMNGSSAMEGFVPENDATVVQRIIAEGGVIIGKTTCEEMCFSGTSLNTKYGPVRNPHNKQYTAGGSSSGSGVVVATGEADMAIGGDQGGSIRIPSSICGIVGLKPTHGLVPYTGAMPILPCVDHLGPMGKTVKDCALLLEVIAGYDDGRDYRQSYLPNVPEYTKHLYPNHNLQNKLKVGILEEGLEYCEEAVKAIFLKAVEKLKTKTDFMSLEEVSLPEHPEAAIAFHAFSLGSGPTMVDNYGTAMEISGTQSPQISEKLNSGYKQHGSELSETLKKLIFFSRYMRQHNAPFYHAKAFSMLHHTRQKYNELLTKFDVIIMPTLPNLPCKIPDAKLTVAETMEKAFNMISNTSVFNGTGHPALSMNCGFSDEGLPVGLMIVGKHFDETNLLYAASVFEAMIEVGKK